MYTTAVVGLALAYSVCKQLILPREIEAHLCFRLCKKDVTVSENLRQFFRSGSALKAAMYTQDSTYELNPEVFIPSCLHRHQSSCARGVEPKRHSHLKD